MSQFEQLLLQMEDGAFAVDARRRVVFWNPACERLLGVSARAALGQPCFEVVGATGASGDRYCGARCSLASLARGGAAPKPMPLWFSPDGAARLPLWVSVFLLPSQQQDLWLVLHVLQRKRQSSCSLPADPAAGTRCRGRSASAAERRDGPLKEKPLALTPREREILDLLAQGHSTTEIARRLYLSQVTVRNHVQHLIAKLGLHSQLEAVAYAYRNDLVGRASVLASLRQAAAASAS